MTVVLALSVQGSDALTALVESSLCIVVTDVGQGDNLITFVNAAFTALTGYTEAEALGRNYRFLHGRDTNAAVVAEISVAVAAGNQSAARS